MWALLLGAVALAAGCAQTTTTTTSTPGESPPATQAPAAAPSPAGANRDRATASDESDPQKRARIRLDLAGAYFAEGQWNTALDEVKQALVASPDLPQALNLRGLIYAEMGEERLAEDSYKRALQVAPADGDVMHNYGWFLCVRKRYVEADTLFQRALATPQYRTASRTLLVQGICEARAGHLDRAEATLKRAYELDAGNPATAMNLADVLYRRGEYERARFYVRRVNNNAELRNAQSLWMAARIERRLGNAQGVREFGNQLLSRYPQSREAAAFERGAFDG
jgi:type IV pilus assembly protein PilF